jgi:uncharacterized protein YjbI with pentapeptide repeats
VDQQQQSRWQPTRRQLLWAGVTAALAFLIIVICGYLFEWKWTGLPNQTFWDWLDLLIVPFVLAIGGYLFTRSENRATQAAAERRAQDEALQAYLDNISNMLIPNREQPSLYKARPGDSLSEVARAQTLTVLPRLDGNRKAQVVQFLYESGLIVKGHQVLNLSGADFSRAILAGSRDWMDAQFRSDLSGTTLFGRRGWLWNADLRGVDLREAILRDALLRGAVLIGADFRRADLRGASLFKANLRGAILVEANLGGTFLRGADLSGAIVGGASFIGADLSEADLYGTFRSIEDYDMTDPLRVPASLFGVPANLAKGWTKELFGTAGSLEGARMPDGQILRGDKRPNGPTFEDWLKDKEGRGKDE